MSEQTKRDIGKVKENFERVVREADDAAKRVGGLDKDLGNKIQRVKEGASEVVKHIEKKTGENA